MTGIDLLLIIAALLLLLALERYAAWLRFDYARRTSRLVDRNIARATRTDNVVAFPGYSVKV